LLHFCRKEGRGRDRRSLKQTGRGSKRLIAESLRIAVEDGRREYRTMTTEQQVKKKPKYEINIEGVNHPWEKDTITVPQIRQLAGWDDTQPVVEVDLSDNSERTLSEDEVVELKPGHGFGKKIKFQRG
jgi:Multiubiquitin